MGAREKWEEFPLEASINDLSSELLVQVTDFLPKTARVLVAVAITAPPSSWRKRGWKDGPSPAGRAVVEATGRVELSVDNMEFDGVCNAEYSQLWTLRKYGPAQIGRHRYSQCSKREALEMEWKKQLGAYYSAEGWSRLDFVDLELELCQILTDDDLGAAWIQTSARATISATINY